MAPKLGFVRTTLAARVVAWREHGRREDADALVGELREDLAELCLDLGVLYADDQAIRAVEAGLQLANPNAAPGKWRRRNPGVSAGEWTDAPAATFQGLCIHALLDNAGVASLDGDGSGMSVPERAALRLRLADVHDVDDVSAWVGLAPAHVEVVWLGEISTGNGEAERRRWSGRIRTRVATAGAGASGLAMISSGAFAATVSAGAVAVAAGAIGLAAATVAIQRVPDAVEVADGPEDGNLLAPDGGNLLEPGDGNLLAPGDGNLLAPVQGNLLGEIEGVEAPLGPDDARPGLNVPTVEVPDVILEDLLPGLVPDLPIDVPGVNASESTSDGETLLPDVIPTVPSIDDLIDLPVDLGG